MNDYDRIKQIIEYLSEHHDRQPDVEELSRVAGLSPSHFHRLFSRWAGITPKSFLKCLTLSHARKRLQSGSSVLDTAYSVGLSGPGRLHDLTVTLESASPGEIKSGGAGWTLEAGFASSPFGLCLIVSGPRGICQFAFVETADRPHARQQLSQDWPAAEICWNDAAASRLVDSVFSKSETADSRHTIKAMVSGTEFQVRVWRALLRIPPGRLTSYGALAEGIGEPKSARAVGSAVARNSIALLIPCHRVIRSTGVVGEYRWGATRKKALLCWESAAE